MLQVRSQRCPEVAPPAYAARRSSQQECSNPNVVRYFGSFVGREFLWIVMEYCGGGAQPCAQ